MAKYKNYTFSGNVNFFGLYIVDTLRMCGQLQI